MCHDPDSLPPVPPGGQPAASDAPTQVQSSDGTRVLAHEARPARPSGAGVVILPDVRGLHPYYRHLAVRFAEIGHETVAIDYFGRTATTDDRSAAFEFRPHVEKVTPAGVAADVAGAVALLRSRGATDVFTVGFCFGGGNSWRQSAETPGLAGAIGFYGRPESLSDVVDRLQSPILMLMGGADQSIPVAAAEALAARASRVVPAECVVFDGQPHSFFDRSYAEHSDACDRAWQLIIDFIGRNRSSGQA
ncbi:dienelactone hydrolase family protein [Microlunatus panaciterrae]|uniref:Carboxymethylenebutenolidase n=1 Tax=Microlunatus panaciterrae TaxID=400768 RepID=A0ABS2RIM4_9ACTN|nr:dienelactone hydrolase family protein [Microlunatus panaciterrae]MBM7798851.1 carboxymethylenebutenolidase [Microlunatus panaciterrae]